MPIRVRMEVAVVGSVRRSDVGEAGSENGVARESAFTALKMTDEAMRQAYVTPKNFYVSSPVAVTIPEVARVFGFSEWTGKAKAARENWAIAREERTRKMEAKSAEKAMDINVDAIADMNERHKKTWKAVMAQAAKVLVDKKDKIATTDLLRIASIVEKAQRGERLARGLTAESAPVASAPVDSTIAKLQAVWERGDENIREQFRASAILLESFVRDNPEGDLTEEDLELYARGD